MAGLAGKCRLEPGSGSSGFQPERSVGKLNLPCNCLPEWTEPLWSPSIVGRAVAARPSVDKTEPKNKRNKTQIQKQKQQGELWRKLKPWPNGTHNYSSQVTTIEMIPNSIQFTSWRLGSSWLVLARVGTCWLELGEPFSQGSKLEKSAAVFLTLITISWQPRVLLFYANTTNFVLLTDGSVPSRPFQCFHCGLCSTNPRTKHSREKRRALRRFAASPKIRIPVPTPARS